MQNSEKGPGAKNEKINSSERACEKKLAILLTVKITEELRLGKLESKRNNNSISGALVLRISLKLCGLEQVKQAH